MNALKKSVGACLGAVGKKLVSWYNQVRTKIRLASVSPSKPQDAAVASGFELAEFFPEIVSIGDEMKNLSIYYDNLSI